MVHFMEKPSQHLRKTIAIEKSIMKYIPILAIFASAFLTGCNKSQKSGQLSIAVIPKGTTHIYWKSV